MAGLAASATLVQSGLDVLLVEAADYLGTFHTRGKKTLTFHQTLFVLFSSCKMLSNYPGGRVKQMKPFDGWPPVDLGGEFIHGSKTITYKLAMENNWEIEMVINDVI